MSTQFETVLLRLREMLMRGDFKPGEHLQEIPLAKMLKVSRTPVRLALGTLAQEELLIHKPQRGFQVRQFTVKEIIDAVAVRGDLEAMACRIVAERGLGADRGRTLRALIDEMGAIAEKAEIDYSVYVTWFELNGKFHDAIVAELDNAYLIKFIRQIDNVPLAASRFIAATSRNAEQIRGVFERSQRHHDLILDALRNRQASRAEALMREHVYQGQQGLRRHLEELRRAQDRTEVPLANLVAPEPI